MASHVIFPPRFCLKDFLSCGIKNWNRFKGSSAQAGDYKNKERGHEHRRLKTRGKNGGQRKLNVALSLSQAETRKHLVDVMDR